MYIYIFFKTLTITLQFAVPLSYIDINKQSHINILTGIVITKTTFWSKSFNEIRPALHISLHINKDKI